MTNVLVHDLLGFELLFKNQLGTLQGKFDAIGLRHIALKMCQTFEAAMRYPESPPGIRIGMQAGLALSVLFLRADEKEIWWCRKTLAKIEANG